MILSIKTTTLLAVTTLFQYVTALPAEAPSRINEKRQLGTASLNTTAVLKRNWYGTIPWQESLANTASSAFWGWYPDDGLVAYGSQGPMQTLEEINAATGTPAFAVGAYAHIDNDFYIPTDPSTYFNGSEILPYIEQAQAAKAIFVASISPIHGYGGFQLNDTNQAVAIVNVLRGFVDAGVKVWLRWGHEMNWYTKSGSDATSPTARPYYSGTAADFVNAWRVTYTVVKTALPTVQFMWCPNEGLVTDIAPFFPGPEYVDSVAYDYYTSIGVPQWWYSTLDILIKQAHDAFALPFGKPFYLGETGTRSNAPLDNLQWVQTITSQETCASMANYQGAFWFNYVKNNLDHRLVLAEDPETTAIFLNIMNSDTPVI